MKRKIQKTVKGFKKGFTLVEVLVVAIIIAILASVAVTAAFNARKTATESTLSSIVTEVNKAMQQASLAAEDEVIPVPDGWSSSAGTAMMEAIARLGFVTISGSNGAYTATIATPASAGANARAKFTAESARKMYELIDRHFNADGTSKSGDQAVKFTLNVNGGATWGERQFYLAPNTSGTGTGSGN